MAVVASLAGAAQVSAATYVYVSNADDGDISTYTMQADGSLQPGARVKVQGTVMPMTVSHDRKFLFAAARSKPFSVHTFAIDPATGALGAVFVSPLAESFPYISLDKTARYLLGASYGANLISVNAVGADGKVGNDPLQVIPIGRNAHSIRVDESNGYVYVPSLGSDQIFQFTFDAKTGKLASNTPAVALMKAQTGRAGLPAHAPPRQPLPHRGIPAWSISPLNRLTPSSPARSRIPGKRATSRWRSSSSTHRAI